MEMPAPGRVVQYVPEQRDQQHHGNHAIGEDGIADLEGLAEELKQRRLRADLLAADRFIGGIQEVGGEEDLPGAQRDDEGWQLHH